MRVVIFSDGCPCSVSVSSHTHTHSRRRWALPGCSPSEFGLMDQWFSSFQIWISLMAEEQQWRRTWYFCNWMLVIQSHEDRGWFGVAVSVCTRVSERYWSKWCMNVSHRPPRAAFWVNDICWVDRKWNQEVARHSLNSTSRFRRLKRPQAIKKHFADLLLSLRKSFFFYCKTWKDCTKNGWDDCTWQVRSHWIWCVITDFEMELF